MLLVPTKDWVLSSVWSAIAVFPRGSAQTIKDSRLHSTELQKLPASLHLNPGRCDVVSFATFLPGLCDTAPTFNPRTGTNQGSYIHLPPVRQQLPTWR